MSDHDTDSTARIDGGRERRRRRAVTSRRALVAAAAGSVLGTAGCTGLTSDGGDDEEEEPSTPGGPPESQGWERTFEDRFDGGGLDADRWSYGMGGGTVRCPTQGPPNHCVADDHVWVDGDANQLRLRASEETPDGDADYTVGAVSTAPAFQQTFGYFEARCRMPADDGTLPAFWLLSDFRDHRYRELTFEARGADDGEAIIFGHQIVDEDGDVHLPEEVGAGTDNFYDGFEAPLDEAFHVLGIEWAPTHVAYYVDGEQVGHTTSVPIRESLPGAPMYVVLNNAVYRPADWVGDPANATFPTIYDVDWVRAWQHEDWA